MEETNKECDNCKRALEVYNTLFNNTESFEGIALTLSYLFPAIIKGSFIEIDKLSTEGRLFYYTMTDNFPKDHFVWKYVKIADFPLIISRHEEIKGRIL